MLCIPRWQSKIGMCCDADPSVAETSAAACSQPQASLPHPAPTAVTTALVPLPLPAVESTAPPRVDLWPTGTPGTPCRADCASQAGCIEAGAEGFASETAARGEPGAPQPPQLGVVPPSAPIGAGGAYALASQWLRPELQPAAACVAAQHDAHAVSLAAPFARLGADPFSATRTMMQAQASPAHPLSSSADEVPQAIAEALLLQVPETAELGSPRPGEGVRLAPANSLDVFQQTALQRDDRPGPSREVLGLSFDHRPSAPNLSAAACVNSGTLDSNRSRAAPGHVQATVERGASDGQQQQRPMTARPWSRGLMQVEEGGLQGRATAGRPQIEPVNRTSSPSRIATQQDSGDVLLALHALFYVRLKSIVTISAISSCFQLIFLSEYSCF